MTAAPSLSSSPIADAYPVSVPLTHKETRLPTATFPAFCPYRREQVFDDDFVSGAVFVAVNASTLLVPTNGLDT